MDHEEAEALFAELDLCTVELVTALKITLPPRAPYSTEQCAKFLYTKVLEKEKINIPVFVHYNQRKEHDA